MVDARRRFAFALAALAALWLCGALALSEPRAVGLYHDDGIYVATARSLAEGNGYRILSLPGAPWQTKYPPLFPLLLAPVWLVAPSFPANAVGFQLVVALFGAALLPLSYLAARRLFGLARGAAFTVAALLAGSSWLLALSRWVLTELPYAAVALAALLVCERAFGERAGATTRAALLAGLLAAGAALLKEQGVVLALAVATLLVVRRRFGDLARFALGWAPLPLAWQAWRIWRSGADAAPLYDYYLSYRGSLLDPAAPATADLLWRTLRNLEQSVEVFGQAVGLPETIPLGLRVALVAALAIGGFAAAWRRGHRLAVLYVAFFLAATVAVPWTPLRYLIPLLPLVLAGFVLAFETLARRLCGSGPQSEAAPGRRRLLRVRAAAILLVSALLATRFGAEVLELGSGGLPGYVHWSDPYRDWRGFEETIDWLGANTAPDDVVASALDPFYYLHTGRRGLRFSRHNPSTYFYPALREAEPRIGTPQEIAPELDQLGVRWLVREPALFEFFAEGRAADRLAQELVAFYGDRARLVFRSGDSGHFVYRIEPPGPDLRLRSDRAPATPPDTIAVSP